MKTLYVLMFLGAAMATVAALPPLGSLAGLPSFGGADDTYDDYADVDLRVEGVNDTNSTDVSDMTSDMTSDDMTSEPSTEDSSDSSSTDDPEPTEPTDNGDDGLSGGAIAGIVIGSIAGVALIAGGVYYLKVKGMLCFE